MDCFDDLVDRIFFTAIPGVIFPLAQLLEMAFLAYLECMIPDFSKQIPCLVVAHPPLPPGLRGNLVVLAFAFQSCKGFPSQKSVKMRLIVHSSTRFTGLSRYE